MVVKILVEGVLIMRRNYDRRNPAGGIGEGERTVRRGGWIKFGDDLFYAQTLEHFAGYRVYVYSLEDAFSPEYARCRIRSIGEECIQIDNLYHLLLKDKLPVHLEFLRGRLE